MPAGDGGVPDPGPCLVLLDLPSELYGNLGVAGTYWRTEQTNVSRALGLSMANRSVTGPKRCISKAVRLVTFKEDKTLGRASRTYSIYAASFSISFYQPRRPSLRWPDLQASFLPSANSGCRREMWASRSGNLPRPVGPAFRGV